MSFDIYTMRVHLTIPLEDGWETEQLIYASTLLRDVPLLDNGLARTPQPRGDQGTRPDPEILDE